MNSFLVLPLTHLKHFTFHFRFGMPGAWAGQGRSLWLWRSKKRIGHQMHEFGSLLSCDFACNPNIWSCKGFYRQYVARFAVSGAQTEHSANLFLLPKSWRETFLQLSKWASENAIAEQAARRSFTSNDRLDWQITTHNSAVRLWNIWLEGCAKMVHWTCTVSRLAYLKES